MKNYIEFVNDHSGSMGNLATAAAADYNATIEAVKNAASREMLDTVVSVVGVGIGKAKVGRYAGHGDGYGVTRQVQISNPHVLKPITSWSTKGGTPLWDGIGDAIELGESLPDANNEDVSFLIYITTDGREEHSGKYDATKLAAKIAEKQRTGRWTFVFRVPKGQRHTVQGLGIPDANIQEWETTREGMARSTVQTQAALDNFYTLRSSGAKSSNVFYVNAAQVNTAALKELDPKEFSLYIVPGQPTDPATLISDFILTKRMAYLKGAAFYQLTKTEPRVGPKKLILVRDKITGKVYAGNEARQMLGIDTVSNVRLHPSDHGNFDIFIQSESWNRHLVGGTGVIYWEKQGKPFTAEDLAKFTPKAPAVPAVVQLPSVPVTNKPTPSPIAKPTQNQHPVLNGRPVKFFTTREEGRAYARQNNVVLQDGDKVAGAFQINASQRWFVYL